MRRFRKFAVGVGGLGLAVVIFGFLLFAASATRPPNVDSMPRADAIVVLTGGAQRIEHGARLLSEGAARRMLISGVNRMVKRSELQRLSKVPAEMFNCCIDVGYAAQNTRGNAMETERWVRRHKFDSLIVVTAGYHMPRSMTELGRVLPSVDLIPYPVTGNHVSGSPWWLDASAVATLASEYLKFLPSAANYAWVRFSERLPTERGKADMQRARR